MAKKAAALLIQPKSAHEQAYIEALLKRLGISTLPLTEEELLDFGLSQMMHRVDRTKRVDVKSAMKVLAS
ncbi:MAG: hypothetical protein LKM36_02970 [Flavobacteriales bacterium]|nr:hypothetical protein [Flavobacteriales bacterium]MCI1751847.1 hypothetical protein [Flavobacteriales bacterium]